VLVRTALLAHDLDLPLQACDALVAVGKIRLERRDLATQVGGIVVMDGRAGGRRGPAQHLPGPPQAGTERFTGRAHCAVSPVWF
jgi:hypothetical protein